MCNTILHCRYTSKFKHKFSLLSLNRDVDDVHDMMDDIQEQNELADEITNALSNPVGFGQDVDEVRAMQMCVRGGGCVWGRRMCAKSYVHTVGPLTQTLKPLVHPFLYSLKDDLLAELEGMEQEELEKDLLEIPAAGSKLPEDTVGLDDLPSVRKCLTSPGDKG